MTPAEEFRNLFQMMGHHFGFKITQENKTTILS